MEITIKAHAHYTDSHTESFIKNFEVTDEEYELIKQCAESNSGKLDGLMQQSRELYNRIYSPIEKEAEQIGRGRGRLRPIRIIGSRGGTVYSHRDLEVWKIIMYLE